MMVPNTVKKGQHLVPYRMLLGIRNTELRRKFLEAWLHAQLNQIVTPVASLGDPSFIQLG